MIISVGQVELPSHKTVPAFVVGGLDSCDLSDIGKFYAEIYGHWMRLADTHADAIPFQISCYRSEITVSVQQPKSIPDSVVVPYLRDLIQCIQSSRLARLIVLTLNLELNELIHRYDPAGMQILQKIHRKDNRLHH